MNVDFCLKITNACSFKSRVISCFFGKSVFLWHKNTGKSVFLRHKISEKVRF